MPEFTTENAIDFSWKTDILDIETKYAVDASGMDIRPEDEDSLENTFSCVPKVQGSLCRISQANGQRYVMQFLSSPHVQTALFILFNIQKEGYR